MLTPNLNFKKRLWVIDNFYPDSAGIIDFAWQQEFVNIAINHNEPDIFSKEKFLFPGIKDAFENIIGKRIIKWEISELNGRFKINYQKDKPVVYSHNCDYGGIVFLTFQLGAYPNGFNLLSHKATGSCYRYDTMDNQTMSDISQFNVIDSVGYFINRLILFDARYFHTIPSFFGEKTGQGWDGFLTQIFYFN